MLLAILLKFTIPSFIANLMSKKEETLFKEKIAPQLKKLGKFTKIQQVVICGTPDFIGCINGVYIELELKTLTGEASKLQQLSLAKTLKNGGIAFQVSPANWAIVYGFLSSLKKSYRVKRFRKYLLKSLQSHAKEIDK